MRCMSSRLCSLRLDGSLSSLSRLSNISPDFLHVYELLSAAIPLLAVVLLLPVEVRRLHQVELETQPRLSVVVAVAVALAVVV